MPLLEEYYYGTNWESEKFSLAKLRARLHPQPEALLQEGEAEPGGQA